MTITEFILARVAENEAVARAAMVMRARYEFPTVMDDNEMLAWDDGAGVGVLVGPERVLAECEAKRRAIDAAWADHVRIEGEWGMGQSREAMDAKGDVPEVVVALASVHVSHPDYRDEWQA